MPKREGLLRAILTYLLFCLGAVVCAEIQSECGWAVLRTLAWFSVLCAFPGYQLSSWIFGSRKTEGELLALSLPIGFVTLGIVWTLLFRSSIAATIVLLSIGAILAYLNRTTTSQYQPSEKSNVISALALFSGFAFFLLFLFGQTSFDSSTQSFRMHLFPSVDLSYLTMLTGAIKDTGGVIDRSQMGTAFVYHDLAYRGAAALSGIAGVRTFDILFFVLPCISIASILWNAYYLIRKNYAPWIAALTALAIILLGSRGIEMTSLLTSPSHRLGIELLLIILITTTSIKEDSRLKLWVFASMLLLTLAWVKVPTWLIVVGAGIIVAILNRTFDRRWLYALIPSIVFLLLYYLFSGTDSLIEGSPLIFGYGLTNIASQINTKLGTALDPVFTTRHFSLTHLLTALVLFIPFLFDRARHCGRLIVALWRGVTDRSEEILLPSLALSAFALWAFVLVGGNAGVVGPYAPSIAIISATLYGMPWALGRWKTSSIIAKAAFTLLLLYDVGLGAYGFYWHRTDTPVTSMSAEYIRELEHIRDITPETALIASHRFDLYWAGDERFFWYGALTGRRVISEGATYGVLSRFRSSDDSIVGKAHASEILTKRRALLDTLYSTSDPAAALSVLEQTKSNYLLIDHTIDQHIQFTPTFLDTLFQGKTITLLRKK